MSLKLKNIGELVTYNSEKKSMVILKDVQIAIENGKISDIGTLVGDCDEILDCKKKLITPGYIDSHTHPVFVNSRYNDFFDRLSGLTYKNIQEKGGGIISSVKDVRKASYKKLIRCVKNRMDRFINMGTTTVECKTGYGLSLELEHKFIPLLENALPLLENALSLNRASFAPLAESLIRFISLFAAFLNCSKNIVYTSRSFST